MFTYSHPYGPPGMNGSASNKEKTVGSFSPDLATSALMAQATFGQPNMLFPQYPQQQAAAAQFIRAQWAQWAMLSQQFSTAHLHTPATAANNNNSQQLSAATAGGFLPFAPPPQRPESSPTAYSDDLTGSVDSPPSSKRPALEDDGCVRCPVCSVKFDTDGNLLDHVLHERSRLDSIMMSIKKKDLDEQICDQKNDEGRGSADLSRTTKSRIESFQRVRVNHRRRIQGKAAAFQLNRDRATPSAGSDRQTNGERSPAIATAVSVTPPTFVGKAEHDSNAISGWLVCKGCETPRDYLQANARCQHLRCVECWQKRLLSEEGPSASSPASDHEDASGTTEQRCFSSEDKFGSASAAVGASCPVCSAPIENLRDVCL